MATPEGALTAPDVTAPPASSASTATDSSSASQGTSSASTPDAAAGSATADVQGTTATTEPSDPLAGVPSIDELNQLPDTTQYKKSLLQLRSAYESIRPQFDELTQKFTPFQPLIERFEKPEQLQSALELQDSLFAWENDESGQPIPNTDKAAQLLSEQHRRHADDLTFALLELPTVDPLTGQQRERIDIVLSGMAADPDLRSRALKILGGVEPNSIAPQWQPTEDELSVVKPELQDLYRSLPYEDRIELKENSPEFINKTLQQLKLNQDLQADRERYQQQEVQRQQAREQYIAQQAQQAGDQYVTTQLNEALSTFHQNVVQQCDFIKPLDLAALPQGITAEQAATINQQVAATNKAEAAQITGMIVSLFNPQTSAYVIPLLKEIGAVDDKMLAELDRAAHSFGNNARNYGNLNYRGQLTANGTSYTPDAGVTQLNNEASRALKSMLGYANQIKGKLIEQRSKFFELRAQQHNNTLNGSAAVRPPLNGTGFNPTAAPPPAASPAGRLTLAEMQQLYG